MENTLLFLKEKQYYTTSNSIYEVFEEKENNYVLTFLSIKQKFSATNS